MHLISIYMYAWGKNVQYPQVFLFSCSSGSMYGRPLLIARLAVSELIDTFSENDFFNVIWVGPRRCYFFRHPGDLKWWERTGTSCQLDIHFSVKTAQYPLKYTIFWFQIYVRSIVLITEHNHKISTSFIKNNKRYNRLTTAEWISISTTILSADWLKYERKITWMFNIFIYRRLRARQPLL